MNGVGNDCGWTDSPSEKSDLSAGVFKVIEQSCFAVGHRPGVNGRATKELNLISR